MTQNTLTASFPVLAADLERAHNYLKQARDMVTGATKGLTAVQWNFRSAPDNWSIAEIVEHMVVIQEFVLGPIREQLANAPAPAPDRDFERAAAIVVHQFPDRAFRFQAPEMVHPTARWTPAVSMKRLLENFDRLNEYLDTTPDLREHVVDAPPMKAVSKGAFDMMDGYEWVLAVGAHTERHTKQILEVKADPNF